MVADFADDADANELFIADGYGNHRVIVIDEDTGAFKRMWGAYGKPPTDDNLPPYDPNSPQFGNPVHCIAHCQRRARLCLRSHQQSHSSVSQGRQLSSGNS